MMPSGASIVVRSVEERDAEAMARTFAASRAYAGTLQLPYPSTAMWHKRIANLSGDEYLLVAEVEDQVVGNCGLQPASKSPRRRHAGTIGLSVRDDWHGRGVGTALLGAAIDLADKWLGYTRLELTAYTDNAAALALYRKFDFVVEGTLRGYALRDGELVDAYAMARFARAKANGHDDTAAVTGKDRES